MPAINWKSTGTHSAAAGAGAVLIASAAFITPWEGTFTRTYKDIVGVDTVCTGETEKWATEEGRRRAFTKTECADMLAKSLPKYYQPMMQCIGRSDVPKSVQVAFTSATYNIGVAGFCRSTMAARAKVGDYRAACHALRNWNRAGGRVVKGLDNRRIAEERTCLKDLT